MADDLALSGNGFGDSQHYLFVLAFLCTGIPNSSPMTRMWSKIFMIRWGVVGAGNGGAALRGVTIMFITMKTPNPYRSEPTMG